MSSSLQYLGNYYSNNSFITILILIWLSIYFIIALTIFISRYTGLKLFKNNELSALKELIKTNKIIFSKSILKPYVDNPNEDKNKLDITIKMIAQKSTSGLTWLSIIASTSPFIGLFGTVISILDTFSKLGDAQNASLNVIAPAISEALVATGCGIFVAIPAYTFHLVLKRVSYELISTLQREADFVKSVGIN